MSTFALHPVPSFDDLPPDEPPPEMFDGPKMFDGPALFDESPDGEPIWDGVPVSQLQGWGERDTRGTAYAFEADLQQFCRSAALRRGGCGYEDVAAARTLLEFARHDGGDEVLRWGPTRVAAFLRCGDPQGSRRALPERERIVRVLRALVHFSHEEHGLDPAWGMLALAAVEEESDAYLTHEAWVAPPVRRTVREELRSLVGGEEALAALDDRPLGPGDALAETSSCEQPPDTSVSVVGARSERVPLALRQRAVEIAELTDGFATTYLAEVGSEFATACRALVARLVDAAPVALFRRDPTMTAAGVVWLIARGNGLMQPGDTLRGAQISTHFALPRGAYGRMHYLVRDVGLDLVGGMVVGQALVIPDASMQLSSTRRRIIATRDDLGLDTGLDTDLEG